MRPGRELLQNRRDREIKGLQLGIFADPFPVRRVHDRAAVLVGGLGFEEIAALEAHVVRNARHLRVVPGHFDGVRVQVAAENRGRNIGKNRLLRSQTYIDPVLKRDLVPRFRDEISFQARRDISANERRLNGNRARAAEGVEQRTLPIPVTQQTSPAASVSRSGAAPTSFL